MDPSVLRLFRFRPVSAGFDHTLREILIPDMLRLEGLRGVFVGRRGPDEIGPRIVASLWSTSEAMTAAVSDDLDPAVFHPELLEATTERTLGAFPLAFETPTERPEDVGILRIVTGRTAPGRAEAYLEEARAGTIADIAAGHGPLGLYLATDPPDGFVTLSLWDRWSTIEAATGADHVHADATRHAEELADWAVEHYEVVPGIAGRMLPAETVSS